MRYRATGEVHSYDSRLRRLGRRTESHVVVRAGASRPSTELDDFVTGRWGLHVRRWGRTWYIPNRHEVWPVHDAEVLALHDEVVASVGLPDLVARPPDHVAFSPGVRTEFGFPADARQPRRS
jgi:uncharacterized protein YqjF (DUF2071 family)